MQLELTNKELEELLLEWAQQRWPNHFNTVEIGGRYSSVGATFKKEEPPPTPIEPQA